MTFISFAIVVVKDKTEVAVHAATHLARIDKAGRTGDEMDGTIVMGNPTP